METQTMNSQDGSGAPMPPEPQQPKQQNNLAVPAAIVIAGALIAFAVYSSPGKPTTVGNTNTDTTAAVAGAAAKVNPVSDTDHLIGNPNADVTVIEYSDLECPFCKNFHETMHQIMDEYGKDGRVSWVYRQFPLSSLHPKAPKEAEAAECVNKLGGNDKFWAFIDKIFEITPSNNGLDPALLSQTAVNLGVDKNAFEQCLNGGEFTKFVSDSVNAAIAAGGQGTPYSIVITKSGKQYPINGALPYGTVKQTIETALAN